MSLNPSIDGIEGDSFPTKVQDCGKCREHYFNNPMLVGAFASVGIEHGKSSWQMAEEYFDSYHRGKHRG